MGTWRGDLRTRDNAHSGTFSPNDFYPVVWISYNENCRREEDVCPVDGIDDSCRRTEIIYGSRFVLSKRSFFDMYVRSTPSAQHLNTYPIAIRIGMHC